MRALPISLVSLLLLAASTVAQAKSTPANPAAEKAALSAEFGKLTTKWQELKKQAKTNNQPISAGQCQSYAKDFAGFSDKNKVAEGYFNAGVLLESCGNDPKGAESAYRDALKVNSNFAPAMVNLGEMAYRAGKISDASSQFEAALKADPKNVQAYNDTALLLFERAKQNNDKALYQEAVSKLRRALAVDADSLAAYSLLALIYYTTAESDRSKLDLAELVCKQAIEVDATYPQIYNIKGLIKLKKKNVTGALQEFKSAVQYDPKYVEAQLNIGAITLSARDYTAAETAFKAVLDAAPTNPQHKFDATMGMGVALRGQRRIDEAEKWYGDAKALNAKECAVAYNLGVLNQDYKGSAEADLNKAKALFGEFLSCARSDNPKHKDASRRIKDIDDTFKAIAESKKLEEEGKKMAEEAAKMEAEQAKQLKEQQEREAKDNPKKEPEKKEPEKAPAPEEKKK